MKIVIHNGNPIRVYHNPREVIVYPRKKLIKTFNHDGTLLETFELIGKELSWCEDNEGDQSEILVTLHIKN
jgi:hypothetical protein